MWQLELIGRVLPAFTALAKDFWDKAHEATESRLRRDAGDCYADLINIGTAIAQSGGEWSAGLDDKIVVALLKALNSRVPRTSRWIPFIASTPDLTQEDTEEHSQKDLFPRLNSMALQLESKGWDGLVSCSTLPSLSTEELSIYKGCFDSRVRLFHPNERRSAEKRESFLSRVKNASKHLLNVYCPLPTHMEGSKAAHSLSKHPSHGFREVANKIYRLLQLNWVCACPQGRYGEIRLRVVRVKLMGHNESPAKTQPLEVLFPVCKNGPEWKATQVQVKSVKAAQDYGLGLVRVDKDICDWLKKSEDVKVDFLVDNNGFWHLKPTIDISPGEQQCMDTLNGLLADRVTASSVGLPSSPQQQLLLCHSLASSLLYFYPGSWLQTAWSSSDLYFKRTVGSAARWDLNLPYLSVALAEACGNEDRQPHMQSHLHPVVLALGIIFLEIVTNTRFPRSDATPQWLRWNKDNYNALKMLADLQREGSPIRLTTGLKSAIRACLQLEQPPDMLTNRLSEEGPIRHYILACIVHPLETDLVDGYNIQPERHLIRPTQRAEHQPVTFPNSTGCLHGGEGQLVKQQKVAEADVWFSLHQQALQQIAQSPAARSLHGRVKVAILDSGLELSDEQMDWYHFKDRMVYRSWLDDGDTMRDDVGHGTHLATLLGQMDPEAAVYVAKVFKKQPTLRKSAEAIDKAIRFAAEEWKVDIIVMAFGFSEEHHGLYEAIQFAAAKGVLIFAAASNDGKNRIDDVAWPARSSGVICVHSADGYGNPSSFTPAASDFRRIMVLGESVRSAWPPRLGIGKKAMNDGHRDGEERDDVGHRRMSGTSCAAVVAAGIAALLLRRARGVLTDQEWGRLHRADSMRRLLEKMSKETPGGYLWVKHWSWFNPVLQEDWFRGSVKLILN